MIHTRKTRTTVGAAALLLGSVFPLTAVAQQFGGADPTFASIVAGLMELINTSIIPVIMGLAVVLFLWGVADWMLHLDNEQKRQEAKRFMLYGIVVLFVMFSVFGIIEIVQRTFLDGGVGGGVPQEETPFPSTLDA